MFHSAWARSVAALVVIAHNSFLFIAARCPPRAIRNRKRKSIIIDYLRTIAFRMFIGTTKGIVAYKKAGGLAESDVRQINILIADDNACVRRCRVYFISYFVWDELTAFTANKLDESTLYSRACDSPQNESAMMWGYLPANNKKKNINNYIATIKPFE